MCVYSGSVVFIKNITVRNSCSGVSMGYIIPQVVDSVNSYKFPPLVCLCLAMSFLGPEQRPLRILILISHLNRMFGSLDMLENSQNLHTHQVVKMVI